MQAEYFAAIDIGGTKIAVSIATRNGPMARIVENTTKTGDERALPEQALRMLEQACGLTDIVPRRVAAVGVAACGPFVRRDGRLCLAAPNICGGLTGGSDLPNDWTAIPLEQVLIERCDQVRIENDCVAALSAERTFGAAMGEVDCVYVTWSTGIGFGLCVDGRILHGKHGNAGHGGHMLMTEAQDAQCGCGNWGDLEALISGRNLGLRMHVPTPDLFAAAHDGDPAARAIAEDAARWFGRGLYNLTAILDTRLFVIGGSVWAHHGAWLRPIVIQEIESRFPALTEGVRVVPAALGNLAADLGAYSLVLPEDWVEDWRRREPWEALRR